MKPSKPFRYSIDPNALSQETLFAQVQESTARNRQFFFIWVSFVLYVIITTAATTDVQLLIPNSTIKLPIVGIDLPLIGFYLVSPFLALILHFNLLQNLDTHVHKVIQWAETYPNNNPPRSLLPTFILNVALLDKQGVFAQTARTATMLVCFMAGPLTNAILFWRFSDYQSWSLSLIQFVSFLLSAALTITAVWSLNKKTSLIQKNPIYLTAFLIFILSMIVSFQFYWVIALTTQEEVPFGFSSRLHPTLTPTLFIPEHLAPLVPLQEDIKIRMQLDGEKEIQQWWRKYGRGVNLSNRSLKYANLTGIDLRKATLTSANLQYAMLDNANLQHAILIKTNLKYASLSHANLQSAKLQGATLKYSRLRFTNLKGAKLVDADFQYTDMYQAKLQDAIFTRANFQNADLWFADFSDSVLANVDFQGWRLKNADFHNAELRNVNFKDANLTEANFQNAKLTRVNLEKANLIHASLSKAVLKDTNLKNSLLMFAGLSNIHIDKNTSFENAKAGIHTSAYAYVDFPSESKSPEHLDINATFELRRQLTESGLVIPSFFNKQLFITPRQYAYINKHGKTVIREGVGLRKSFKLHNKE